MRKLNDSVYIPWLLMAVCAPLIVQSAASNVYMTAVTAGFCMIPYWKPETEYGCWQSLFRMLATALIIPPVLEMAVPFWPGRGAIFAIPAVLLILAVWAGCNGAERAAASVNILRYGFWAICAVILLSAIRDVHLAKIQAEKVIPNGMLGSILLLPTLSDHKGKRRTAPLIFSTAVISAAVCQGVLGKGGNFRILSRSISLFGTLQRFESLASAALTVGLFSTVVYLLTISGENYTGAGLGKHKTGVILAAVLASVVCFLPWKLKNEALFVLILLLFTVIPAMKALLRG